MFRVLPHGHPHIVSQQSKLLSHPAAPNPLLTHHSHLLPEPPLPQPGTTPSLAHQRSYKWSAVRAAAPPTPNSSSWKHPPLSLLSLNAQVQGYKEVPESPPDGERTEGCRGFLYHATQPSQSRKAAVNFHSWLQQGFLQRFLWNLALFPVSPLTTFLPSAQGHVTSIPSSVVLSAALF